MGEDVAFCIRLFLTTSYTEPRPAHTLSFALPPTSCHAYDSSAHLRLRLYVTSIRASHCASIIPCSQRPSSRYETPSLPKSPDTPDNSCSYHPDALVLSHPCVSPSSAHARFWRNVYMLKRSSISFDCGRSSRQIRYSFLSRPRKGCHVLDAVNSLPPIIMYLWSLALPLATFYSIASVSATPPVTPVLPSLPPVSQPTNATNYDPRICIKNRRPFPFSMRYMLLSHCQAAINLLPSSPSRSLFRDYGDTDLYYLPQVRTQRNCQVTISLPYDYNSETSSWDELKLEANYLADKCCSQDPSGDLALSDNPLRVFGGPNNKGAYTPAGLHGKIRIDLAYVSTGSEDEENANETITLSLGATATNSKSAAVLGETTAARMVATATNPTPDTVAAA